MTKTREDNAWGRWGESDERGTLNYLTPEVVKKAAGIVKKGKVYSLGIPWKDAAPQDLRGRPMHFMRVDGGDYAAGSRRIGGTQVTDDFIFLNTHQVTHVDALCHIYFDDKLYNGFSSNTVRSAGARHCGIEKMNWMVTRGLLLDIAGYRGVERLEKSEVITSAEIRECAKREGISIDTGDAVLLRTGWITLLRDDPGQYVKDNPGPGVEAALWLRGKGVCAVAADNNVLEVEPSEDKEAYLPAHRELIRQGGVYILEHVDMEALARDKVYEFLFIVAPLGISGGSGSPVNPLAIV